MTITDNQRAAIEATGNVLVMAGAGSGKTSTLVERCLHHVLHPSQPVSVTEMLIVTFTEAAATEVRRRIAERLETERAGADPLVGSRLERELALLESSHISTLHSFCLHLVREHFQDLGLDPAIAVFREEQAALFMQMAMDRLLQRHFEAATKDAQRIHELIEAYAAGDEEKIRALVLRLHRYTQTLAQPAAWLSDQTAGLQHEQPTRWRNWLDKALVDWCDRWAPALERVAKNSFANQFLARVKAARGTGSKQFAALFADIAAAVDPVPKGRASHRDEIEDFFAEAAFLGTLLPQPGKPDPLAEDWEWVRGHMGALLGLTQEFAGEYARLKRDHAALDFHDLEQFALDLLVGTDRTALTPIALACQRRFKLIFVDEYQDINAAQDAILRALAGHNTEANRFLVGDVKQSIYRFRLADPAIFQSYHATWRRDPGQGRVITLSDNFRSPAPLLDFVNAVFGSLMKKDLGGVEYDADARLRSGDSERPKPSGAERRGGIGDPVLRQRDDIEIPFDDHRPIGFADAFLGLVEAIESRALVEQRRLARIEVLRQRLIEHPAAESDHFSRGTENRKNHPAEEFLVKPLLAAFGDQAQPAPLGCGDIFLPENPEQTGAGARCVADHESLRRGFIDSALLEIGPRLPTLWMAAEQFAVIERNALIHPVESFALAALLRGDPVAALHGDAVTLRDALDRFGKSQAVVVHQKVKNTAAGVAAETMIDAFFLAHGDRWRFFGVKRAQPQIIASGFFQRDEIGNHLDNGSSLSDLGDFFLGDHRKKLEAGGTRRRRIALRRLAVKKLFFADFDKTLPHARQRAGEIRILHIFTGGFGQQRR